MPLDQTESRSYKVRQAIDHPVIDGDGHTQEYHPILLDYLKEEGGAELVERYRTARLGRESWHRLSPEERFDRQARRPPFWTMPAKNTLDLATAMLPNLFRARMDEMGMDYAVVYTSQFIFGVSRDEEIRRVGCRALNRMNADRFREHADRMTVAAVIPTWTPEEAIEELEYCVDTLGFKAIQLTNLNFRPIPIIEREAPEVSKYAHWVDPLALDSPYDYDPMWAKCVELRVAPTAHVGGQGWGPRRSISNYVYNHIGAFAMANDAFCKALFLGGVTRRFPELNFGFLEGGVSWASQLYNELIEHWEKRSLRALRENLDPARIDRGLLAGLVEEYGGEAYTPFIDRLRATNDSTTGARPGFNPEPDDHIDDWARCGIEKVEDIYDLFVPHFYFGCEADDRLVATAFDSRMNHMGAKLGALFSSDVSHWDVPDMRDTLAEAHELVEKGLIDDDDFRAFTFTNMVRLHAGVNPDFFKGTAVEDAAAGELARIGLA
ncbi:MAG TPA: amidohydrolase family protein [Alphaproteobacteria bacterium]|jgi:predicted TIM-barrel fold metal-dependent hydrolase